MSFALDESSGPAVERAQKAVQHLTGLDIGREIFANIELLCQYDHLCVAGNHDWAAVGRIDTADFNPDAVAACRWTAQQLKPGDIKYLESLPLVIQKGDFTLVHGSPREPIWEYLVSSRGAEENSAYFETRFCLVGHSHVPLVFEFSPAGTCSLSGFPAGGRLVLGENRLIINPGGVGQPRDGDSRASYAIYDSDAMSISHRRIPYDIGVTQARMMEHGLPVHLVTRLSYGM